MSAPATTLVKLFTDCVAHHGNRTALHLPSADGKTFHALNVE